MKVLTFRKPSLEQLKKKSKDWSPQQWEDYLKTLEVRRREENLKKGRFADFCSNEENREAWDSHGKDYLGEDNRSRLRSAIMNLPDNEQKCIRLIFWEGFTLEETAKVLGFAKMTVVRWKEKILKSLEGDIEINHPVLAMVKGGSVDSLTRRELFAIKCHMGMIPKNEIKISQKEQNKLFESARRKIVEHHGRNILEDDEGSICA